MAVANHKGNVEKDSDATFDNDDRRLEWHPYLGIDPTNTIELRICSKPCCKRVGYTGGQK